MQSCAINKIDISEFTYSFTAHLSLNSLQISGIRMDTFLHLETRRLSNSSAEKSCYDMDSQTPQLSFLY